MFPFWILLELRMMEAVLTGGAIRRVISSQISTNNKPTASCLQGGWSVFLGRMLINGESGYTCMSEAKGHHFEHLIHWTGSFQNHHHRAQPALLRVTNSLPRKHVKLRVISKANKVSKSEGTRKVEQSHRYYASAPRAEALSDAFVWRLSVCLSRTPSLSREQRGIGRLKLSKS